MYQKDVSLNDTFSMSNQYLMTFPLCHTKKPTPTEAHTTVDPMTIYIKPRGGSGIPVDDPVLEPVRDYKSETNETMKTDGNDDEYVSVAASLWNNKWAALIGGILLGMIIGIIIGIIIVKQWGKGTEQKYRSKSASESVSFLHID